MRPSLIPNGSTASPYRLLGQCWCSGQPSLYLEGVPTPAIGPRGLLEVSAMWRHVVYAPDPNFSGRAGLFRACVPVCLVQRERLLTNDRGRSQAANW